MSKKKTQRSFKNAVFGSEMFRKFVDEEILDKKEISECSFGGKVSVFDHCGFQGHLNLGGEDKEEVDKDTNNTVFMHKSIDNPKIEKEKNGKKSRFKDSKDGKINEDSSISINKKQGRMPTKYLMLRLPRNFPFENLKIKIDKPPFMHEVEEKEKESGEEDRIDNIIDNIIKSAQAQVEDGEEMGQKTIKPIYKVREDAGVSKEGDASIPFSEKAPRFENVTVQIESDLFEDVNTLELVDDDKALTSGVGLNTPFIVDETNVSVHSLDFSPCSSSHNSSLESVNFEVLIEGNPVYPTDSLEEGEVVVNPSFPGKTTALMHSNQEMSERLYCIENVPSLEREIDQNANKPNMETFDDGKTVEERATHNPANMIDNIYECDPILCKATSEYNFKSLERDGFKLNPEKTANDNFHKIASDNYVCESVDLAVNTNNIDITEKNCNNVHSNLDNANEDIIDELCSLSFGSHLNNDSSTTSFDTDDSTKYSSGATSSFLSDISEDSQSFEFPEDEEQSMESINWRVLEPVIAFVLSNCTDHECKLSSHKDRHVNAVILDKQIENKIDLIESPQRHSPKKGNISQSVLFDPRYLYFLKKVCNLSKKECVAYVKEQTKLLIDRSNRNKAKLPPPRKYRAVPEILTADEKDSSNRDCVGSMDEFISESGSKKEDDLHPGINIFYLETRHKSTDGPPEFTGMNSIFLRKVPEISNITLPSYEKEDFEYMVYKYGENLELISKSTGIDIKDVILIYYLRYHNVGIQIVGSLLDKYVDEEWCINDRILFEENFSKYGTKFNKFMMNKHEDELRIYYKYYLKNYLPVNWSEWERALFAHLIGVYKKDWSAMSLHFQGEGIDNDGHDSNCMKNANDLRVYYSSYFKKLDEEERLRELQLVDVEFPKLDTIHRKRGRKPSSLKILQFKNQEVSEET